MSHATSTRRSFMQKTAAGLGVTALSGWLPAHAAWPEKPVRIVVPYAPGGANDVVARLVAQALTARSGQQVIVENRPGGGATIGGAAVASAAPDGQTLLLASSTFATHPAMFPNLSYDTARDLLPVVRIADGPIILTASPTLPVNSVADLIEYAKKNPGKLNFGTSGNAGTPHLAGEYFAQQAGIKLTYVPYKGDAPAVADVLGGTLSLAFSGLAPTIQHIKAGKLKGLGVTTRSRLDVLPDVPAIGETVKGYELVGWFSLMAPAGTPAPVVQSIAESVLAVANTPEMKAKLEAGGLLLSTMGPAEFKTYFASEIKKMTDLIKSANIKMG
ncbi:tripartite tricarboxylate transporter substrate binding protein [Ramlibacter sp. AW1]|uniref:Tripartite tricarboxylate transporter substrate binding protein n=1 Tax=Ramlibacter aurantiacus TaxID=2801330 RepID=A0A936ZQM4_9BURK|nr:tripartite tricarboxylate transporter substrate binding protein [Ramlibacter aurantiacus]MBL0418904.1 tripartite tricarboxylate transporter substrate binding protein [Ramlibacter aurantiacus]